jgi:hypothetical protein
MPAAICVSADRARPRVMPRSHPRADESGPRDAEPVDLYLLPGADPCSLTVPGAVDRRPGDDVPGLRRGAVDAHRVQVAASRSRSQPEKGSRACRRPYRHARARACRCARTAEDRATTNQRLSAIGSHGCAPGPGSGQRGIRLFVVCLAICRHHRGGNPSAVTDRHPMFAGPGTNLRVPRQARRARSSLSLHRSCIGVGGGCSNSGLPGRRRPPCRFPILDWLARPLSITRNGQRDAVQGAHHAHRVLEGFA